MRCLASVAALAMLAWGQCSNSVFVDFGFSGPFLQPNWTLTGPWTTSFVPTPLGNGPSGGCVPTFFDGFIYLDGTQGASGGIYSITSPPMDIAGEANPEVSFCYWKNFTGGNLELQVSTDNAVSWTNLWTFPGTTGAAWAMSGPIALPTGPIVLVRWRCTRAVGSPSEFSFDNLRICGVPLPRWQPNTPNASMTMNGATIPNDQSGPATAEVLVGSTNGLDISSALTGNPFDIMFYPIVLQTLPPSPLPVSAAQGGVVTADREIIHISPTWGSIAYLNGGLSPDLATTAISNTSIPVQIPPTSIIANRSVAGQMGVVNPANLSGLSFSQALKVDVPSVITRSFAGDDAFLSFNLGLPLRFYGQDRTTMTVSTNGWIKFGSATSADRIETEAKMVSGTPGGGASAPVIAVLWEDLDMGNRPTSQVVVTEFATFSGSSNPFFVVEWLDGDYFPSTTFGNISCVIWPNGAGVDIENRYLNMFTFTTFPTEGIVGVSSGTGLTNSVFAHDLVMGGAVNSWASQGAPTTLFQNFDGTGSLVPPIAAEPMDLAGRTLTFSDPTGLGHFSLN